MSKTNLDKIKERLQNLKEPKKNRNNQDNGLAVFWKPPQPKKGETLEHQIRLVPAKSGDPLHEYWSHYDMGVFGFLSPFKNFNVKDDPIQALLNQLWNEWRNSDDEDEKADYRAQIKKLTAKQRFYALVLVRGEEDKGVRIWTFGKEAYNQILNGFLDPDYGDLADPDVGYDLKLTVTKDADYPKTDVKIKPKPSKLGTKEQVKEWLEKAPDIETEIFRNGRKTADQIQAILDNFIEPPSDAEKGRTSSKRDSVDVDLDELTGTDN